MAEGLSSAQVIGGVVVTIGADLAGLRAGEREAKTIATNIERTVKVNLPVLFDASRLAAQVPQLAATANAMVRSMPPIRIPVMLDLSGLAAQLGAVRGMMGGGGFGIPTVTSGAAFGGGGMPPPLLPGAAGAAGGGGPLFNPGRGWTFANGSPSPVATATVTGGGTTQITSVNRVGGGSAPPGTVMSSWGSLGQGVGGTAGAGRNSRSSVGPLIGALVANSALRAVGQAAEPWADFAGGYGNNSGGAFAHFIGLQNDFKGSNELRYLHGAVGVNNSLSQVPVFGGAAAFAEGISGAGAAVDRAQASKDKVNAAADSVAGAKLGIKAALASASGNDVGAVIAGGEQQLADARKLAVASGGAGMGVLTDTEKLVAMQTARAYAVQSAELGTVSDETTSAGYRIGSAKALNAGDGDDAFRQGRASGRVDIEARYRTPMASASGDKLDNLKRQRANDLAEYDFDTSQQAADRKKRQTVDLQTAQASTQEATLRINRQAYAADLSAFDAASKAKLALIKDVAERQNEATRDASQRAVIVAQEQHRVGTAVNLSNAGATAAGLRIGHRGDEAALVEFDAQREETLKNIANPKERAAKAAELRRQRTEIVVGQAEHMDDRQAGYSTRTSQAKAFDRYGMYQSGVAGVIGQIAGYKSELRNAPADDVQQIRSTQVAELESMQKRIIGQNAGQYAQSFDARYDAARGGENESVKELKLIKEYLRQLVAANGGGAATQGVP